MGSSFLICDLVLSSELLQNRRDYLTTPPNQPVAVNTRNHKPDAWWAGIYIEQSPTTVHDNRYIQPSEDERYAEVEVFVPKMLGT